MRRNISINVDNRVIEGVICLLEESHLGLLLTNPEIELIDYSNPIPRIYRQSERYLDTNGEITDYCFLTAAKSLISLYTSYQFIKENKRKVQKSIVEFRELVNARPSEMQYPQRFMSYEKTEIKKKLGINEDKFNNYKDFLEKIKFILIEGRDNAYSKMINILDSKLDSLFGYKVPPPVKTFICNQGVRN